MSAPVQYGPRVNAMILYLYVGQFLSKDRTAQALAELFGTPVSAGTVAAMTARAADGLSGFLSWPPAHGGPYRLSVPAGAGVPVEAEVAEV